MADPTPGEGAGARLLLAGTRFADVRWVAETGSTNADVLALARDGEPEGIVCVADHQRAGRGRQGRTWTAPSGASLLFTVLLRPPARVATATTMAMAVAVAEAVEAVAGVSPGLKWPNDLVWPADAEGPSPGADRKLGGILAELDWPPASRVSAGWVEPGPSERVVVALGVGLNVNWPAEVPDELAGLAVALNHVTGRTIDREELLVALLRRFDGHYASLTGSRDRSDVQARWRSRSATLGRRVRVDLGTEDVEGMAVDITAEGHLVVDTGSGARRTFAVGDVVHLRPLG
jgi:BirA family biotin operon repressor/biotin-[acetyl-CoA-carboxylase] ligase